MASQDSEHTQGHQATSSDNAGLPASEVTGICALCHAPLTRPAAGGGCPRCMMRLAIPEENLTPGTVARVHAEARRYSHFEIVLRADGSLHELGHGSMGTTYRAQDTVLESPVALKVISKDLVASPEVRARFLREARLAARLHHPNVAKVFHYGEQDGECFYVMELVEGETLEERVRRDGPLTAELTLEIATQVARALAAAEAQTLVHRDLKPSNIMLLSIPGEHRPDDEPSIVKVIDFGLAKAVAGGGATAGGNDTRHGFVGTPCYASPEQFTRGEQPVNTCSDIYSLGVTLWVLLCGHPPFVGSTLTEIHRQQTDLPLPLERLAAHKVPAPVASVLRTMLAADPGARPSTAYELLGLLRRCQERCASHVQVTARRWVLRGSMALATLAIMAAGGWAWWNHRNTSVTPTDKSLAVLPFENRSPDEADDFFTRGVQGEISENLGRIADLKVIDVNSADAYPPGKRDLTQVGRELGVWHLLEGSLQREEGQIHIQVRLVDLRDPNRSWTAHYDRLLTDVFAVQGEITHAVAARLEAKLSPRERAVIDEPPTHDLAAYDDYLRADVGTNLVSTVAEGIRYRRDTAVPLLNAAVGRDSHFALAYCRLATAYDWLQQHDPPTVPQERTTDYRSLAEAALANARRLRPDAGELHLAQAIHFLDAAADAEQARIEVDLARAALPNNAEVELITGNIVREQNHWEQALHYTERSLALDPRNVARRFTLAYVNDEMGLYDAADRLLDRVIADEGPDAAAATRLFQAILKCDAQADTAPLRAALDALTPEEARRYRGVCDTDNMFLALYAHDASTVSKLASNNADGRFLSYSFAYPKAWMEALAARMRQDRTSERIALLAARAEVDSAIGAGARNGRLWGLLAMIDAGLGKEADAVREARHACDLTPLEQSAENAPLVAANLAVVYAWTDQPDFACGVLEEWAGRPSNPEPLVRLSYGGLRLSPVWDSLRGQPRFEALIQRLSPKHDR